jgi:glycosyltransferase involved in cell wall biosynthesis
VLEHTRPVTVSVVTVVRNGRRHLDDAIESVLTQGYEWLEFIIIDGASTDGTVEIIQRHEASLASWVSEPDGGIFDAWNKGISRASGDLVKLLNADDRLTPGSVRRAVEAYEAGGRQEVVIASDVPLIDEHGTRLKVLTNEHSINPVGAVLHPSWFVDRRIYERLGLYRTNYLVAADYEMHLRLRSHDVAYLFTAEPLAEFRTGGTSGSGLGGLFEGYSITKQYVSHSAAIRMVLRGGRKKLRHAAMLRLLGERNTYRVQSSIRQRLNSRGPKR